jgi:hypothetical protein
MTHHNKRTTKMRDYKQIKGFEGPLRFNDRTLYWDKKEGQYYDPDTDLYLSQEQADNLRTIK